MKLRWPLSLLACSSLVSCSDDSSSSEGGLDATGSTSTTAASSSETATTRAEEGASTNVDSGSNSTTGTAGSGETSGSSSETESETGQGSGGLGELPIPPDNSGVVYVGHFESFDLRWYRIDGPAPREAGSLEMVGSTHDLDLDPIHDTLYVAHDVNYQVSIFTLDRPEDPETPVEAPSRAGAIELETRPRFVRVDPYRRRLYVVADSPREGSGESSLYIYDVTDPSAAASVTDPVTIPLTTSLDLDSVRGVLFVVDILEDTLHGYDLVESGIDPMPGSPIDLRALYPQTNQVAFNARELTVDPWHHRLYAARSQGALSELIVLDYPAAINGPGETYGSLVSLDEFVPVPDAFDVDVDILERPGILDAHTPLPSWNQEIVFLAAATFVNGHGITATMLGMNERFELTAACSGDDSVGCLYRAFYANRPQSYLGTDGGACLDPTHRVTVGTTLGSSARAPGSLVFFRYDDDDGSLSRWLTSSGGNATAGYVPVAAACH